MSLIWSMIVRFSSAGTTNYICLVGAEVSGEGGVYFEMRPYHDAINKLYASGNYKAVTESPASTGVMAVAGTSGYLDGVEDVSGIPAKAGTFPTFYMGAVHHDGGAERLWNGNIQAVAIYSGTLTAKQVSLITHRMNALTG